MYFNLFQNTTYYRNGKEGKSWRQKRTRTAIRQRLKPVQVGPIDISPTGMRFYYIRIIHPNSNFSFIMFTITLNFDIAV